MVRLEVTNPKPIGQGSFSNVYRGALGSNAVAIKRLRYRPDQDYAREAEMLSRMDHKNIVGYIGIFRNDENTFDIVLELACGLTLAGALHRSDLKTAWKRSTIHQISSGLSYMHGQGMLHLDLKPPNILFKNRDLKTILIADFGMATASFSARRAGAKKFRARDSPFTQKSDVFSLASIACCVLHGHNPESREETVSIVEEVLARQRHWSQSWLNVLRQGVAANYLERPTAARFRDAFEEPRKQPPCVERPRVQAPRPLKPSNPPVQRTRNDQPPVQPSWNKQPPAQPTRINEPPVRPTRRKQPAVQPTCIKQIPVQPSRIRQPQVQPPHITRHPVQVSCIQPSSVRVPRMVDSSVPVHGSYGSYDPAKPTHAANQPEDDRSGTANADDPLSSSRMVSIFLAIGKSLRKCFCPCCSTAPADRGQDRPWR